jgi:hypothetical protein
MGEVNGALGLIACVGAVHPCKRVVVEGLDPEAESGDPKLEPSVDLGFGHVLRVGFQGDFSEA